MSSTAPQQHEMTAGEERVLSVSFVGKLDPNEKLASVTSVTQFSQSLAASTVLTFSNSSVAATDLNLNNKHVPAGEAVLFKATGGTAGTAYVVKIIAVTNGSVPQTVHGYCTVKVIPGGA